MMVHTLNLTMFPEVLSSIGLTSCLGLLALLVVPCYWFLFRVRPNQPPSPGVSLPFIGHIHLLDVNPRNQFKKWASQLGDVFRLQMGSQTVVVLNNYDLLKEAFVKQADHFSDRPTESFFTLHTEQHTDGILFSSGPNWKDQRTTSLSILRTFGMGKNILAQNISEEVSLLMKELEKINGRPSDIKSLINVSIANVICSIIFGKRFEFDDPKFIKMMTLFNDLTKYANGVLILNFIPVLYYLPFDIFKGRALLSIIHQMHQFNRDMVNEIKKDYDPNNLDNYIVAYIDAMKTQEKAGHPTHLDENNLIRNIEGLFGAGTETTSTTILWSLLYVLHNPDVQKKIYKEIVEHVGTERMPNMADKPKLKFLTAFIMEVQRIASIVPFSLPHECSKETTIGGYTIPKGTQVFPNLDAVLRSEKIWGDPDTFRPERFLDERGDVITREELIPFSIGRRICIGEALAKMELFLYLSSLFQRFEFLPPDPDNIPPMIEEFGASVVPAPYEIRCVLRGN